MTKKTKTIALLIVTLLVWGYSALEWINYADASNNYQVDNSQPLIAFSSPLKIFFNLI